MKNAENRKEFLEKEKGKENQKGKEKKIRVAVVKTVLLGNGAFAPCREQVVLTKIGESDDFTFYPQKQGALLLGHGNRQKLTKMAGATQAKITVLQKHRFRHFFKNEHKD